MRNFVNRFFPNQASDVEDVVQETYLRAYVAEQSREIRQPKSFLFSTARNIAINKLSKKSRQITSYLEDFSQHHELSTESAASDLAEARQQLSIYCAAVEALDGKCREIFLLRKVHGMSHKEIASHMSLSISSVEKYLRKGILAFHRYVQSSNSVDGKTTGIRLASNKKQNS